MPNPAMALAEPAEEGADVDVLRQMGQFMAQRLMEIDVEGRCGAGYDEKSAERTISRNGYRERTWETRAGSVELKIPKRRRGSYNTLVPGAPQDGREGASARVHRRSAANVDHKNRIRSHDTRDRPPYRHGKRALEGTILEQSNVRAGAA